MGRKSAILIKAECSQFSQIHSESKASSRRYKGGRLFHSPRKGKSQASWLALTPPFPLVRDLACPERSWVSTGKPPVASPQRLSRSQVSGVFNGPHTHCLQAADCGCFISQGLIEPKVQTDLKGHRVPESFFGHPRQGVGHPSLTSQNSVSQRLRRSLLCPPPPSFQR